MTHTYSDEDVQKLVESVKSLITCDKFRHDWPATGFDLKARIKPFEPDPWEELAIHNNDLYDWVSDVRPCTPEGLRNRAGLMRKTIDRAVELGLVTKVEGTR